MHRQLWHSIHWRFMALIFVATIDQPTVRRRPAAPWGKVAGGWNCHTPFSFFLHREDSEPDRVALRNRLAPTQPFSPLTSAGSRPTECQVNRSFRSESVVFSPPATIAAPRCGFTSRSTAQLASTSGRKQLGGRQADGFRRTIGFDKNQRGVWEYLK